MDERQFIATPIHPAEVTADYAEFKKELERQILQGLGIPHSLVVDVAVEKQEEVTKLLAHHKVEIIVDSSALAISAQDATEALNKFSAAIKSAEPKKRKPGRTIVNRSPKIGRNQSCPCGSGKKFKACCLLR